MNDIRKKHGLIDPEIYTPGTPIPENKQLHGTSDTAIVSDSHETEMAAMELARSPYQRRKIETWGWKVDYEKWNLRERMEAAGFEFEALGREYLSGPIIYRITRAPIE